MQVNKTGREGYGRTVLAPALQVKARVPRAHALIVPEPEKSSKHADPGRLSHVKSQVPRSSAFHPWLVIVERVEGSEKGWNGWNIYHGRRATNGWSASTSGLKGNLSRAIVYFLALWVFFRASSHVKRIARLMYDSTLFVSGRLTAA